VRLVYSWDVATMVGDHNEYSVCTTWFVVKNDFYLADVFGCGFPILSSGAR
jgi:phage terminase large subunit-like protein